MESPDANWAPQSPDLSSYHSADAAPVHPQHHGYRGSVSHINPYSPPVSSPALSSPTALHSRPSPYMSRPFKQEEGMQDPDYIPDAPPTLKSRGKKPKLEDNGTGGVDAPAPFPGTENIVIKNHFPVARIKRIMQADDDVGKVAQVTPVVVSKALELFMISLVTKAAAEAKAKNSKRVATVHLKQAITKDEQFDFLSEIVSKIADAPAAVDKNDPDAMDVDGKKRKTTGRKKKKAEEEDF